MLSVLSLRNLCWNSSLNCSGWCLAVANSSLNRPTNETTKWLRETNYLSKHKDYIKQRLRVKIQSIITKDNNKTHNNFLSDQRARFARCQLHFGQNFKICNLMFVCMFTFCIHSVNIHTNRSPSKETCKQSGDILASAQFYFCCFSLCV